MSQSIHFNREGHIGRVMLDRPMALNALSLPMIKDLYKQLVAWNKDPSVHAILLEANHERVFCAGGDVRWLYEQRQKQDHALMDFFWHEYRLNAYIASLNKPYIALMNGITMGGGAGISLHGSHPIATEKFTFAMPEAAIGLFPDVGMSHLLSRLPAGLGAYLALTGSRLAASDALSVGLVKTLIPENSIPDLIDNLIESDLSEHAYDSVNRCLHAVSIEPESLPAMSQAEQQRIEACFNHQTVENIFKALRACENQWARDVEAQLLQCSPLSLKVTLLQLQKASTLDVFECLQMDEILVGHFMQGHDFFEGVRARLIDKDKTPHWQPSQLEMVSDELVASYFVSL